MTALDDIEEGAKCYADTLRRLSERVTALDADIAKAKKRHLPAIKRLAAAAAAQKTVLRAAIAVAPDDFKRPRTRILHGIRVGFRKSKGKLVWVDAAQVIRLIRRHLGDQAAVLIKTAETPVRAAIEKLPAADLKRIGVSVKETGDALVVEQAEGEIEKLVDALLNQDDAGATEESEGV